MANYGYSVYQEAQADQLDQAQLILMMFAGSINYLNKAIETVEGDRIERCNLVSKTKNVILELISSLDIENSGEMGEILLRTYRRLFIKLNVANIENDIEKIVEVRNSLQELEDSWRKVFQSEEYSDFKRDRERFIKKQRVIKR